MFVAVFLTYGECICGDIVVGVIVLGWLYLWVC